MTVSEMIKKITLLLGYTDANGEIGANTKLKQSAIIAINAVYSDLFNIIKPETVFTELTRTDEKINLPVRVLNDIMPYGAAAFLAQSENDGDQQQFYIMLYNSKRACLTKTETIIDNLPRPE